MNLLQSEKPPSQPVGCNSEAYGAANIREVSKRDRKRDGGLRFANPPYGLRTPRSIRATPLKPR